MNNAYSCNKGLVTNQAFWITPFRATWVQFCKRWEGTCCTWSERPLQSPARKDVTNTTGQRQSKAVMLCKVPLKTGIDMELSLWERDTDSGREGDGKSFPEQTLLVLELEWRSQEVVWWKQGQEFGGTVHAKSPSRRGAGVYGNHEKASVAGPQQDQGWSGHRETARGILNIRPRNMTQFSKQHHWNSQMAGKQ